MSVYIPSNNKVNISYKNDDFKREFVEKLLNIQIQKRYINFIENGYKRVTIKSTYNTKEEIEESFKTLTLPNGSELIKTLMTQIQILHL